MTSLSNLLFLIYAVLGASLLFTYIANVQHTSQKTPIESDWVKIDAEAVPAVGIEAVLDAFEHSTLDSYGENEEWTKVGGYDEPSLADLLPAASIEAVLDAVENLTLDICGEGDEWTTLDGCGEDGEWSMLDGEAEDEEGCWVDGEDRQDDGWTIV